MNSVSMIGYVNMVKFSIVYFMIRVILCTWFFHLNAHDRDFQSIHIKEMRLNVEEKIVRIMNTPCDGLKSKRGFFLLGACFR